MLTTLHIKNFKAWKDTGEIRLAPLTVIGGFYCKKFPRKQLPV